MMNEMAKWICLFPTLIIGIACTIFGCLWIAYAIDKQGGKVPSKDEIQAAVLSGMFGVAVLSAIALIWFCARA